MTPQNVLDITRDGLLLIFWITLPVVAVATASALLVSVVQAVTQIQDQSISQSIRLIAVMLTVVVASAWLGRDVLRFGERALQMVAQLS
jgi:type III secretion protein S